MSAYEGVDISDITRIQSAESRKDPKAIKRILGKPSIEDSTALGYGRWANQYIDLIDQPDGNEKRILEANYAYDSTKSFKQNLVLLGNQKSGGAPPRDPRKSLNMGFKTTTISNQSYGYLTKYKIPDKKSFETYMRRLAVAGDFAYTSLGITKMRVFIKLKGLRSTRLGDVEESVWVSTPDTILGNASDPNLDILDLMKNFRRYIDDGTFRYNRFVKEDITIIGYERIEVAWYN